MALDPLILAEYNETRDARYTHLFCHAPFTSLNFEQNGNVTACCYNRTAVLGTYPDQSIDEIWNGSAASEFREQMRSGSPPEGCEICVNQFTNRNFQGLKARFYDGLADPIASTEGILMPPSVMEFEISNTCNLECIMCNGYYSSSIRKNREHLPPLPNPYDEEFVAQLDHLLPNVKEARFLGGEPFLVKIYHRIWDRIADVNPDIRVSITTNGTVLKPAMKDMLERIEANIILSLDSLHEATYESIRVNARFSDVMDNLLYFEDYVARKGTEVTIALCVMQQNWRELPNFLDFCDKHNFRLYCNTVLNPEHATLRALSSTQLSEIARTWIAHRANLETQARSPNYPAYEDMIRQVDDYLNRAREWEALVKECDAAMERASSAGRFDAGIAPEQRRARQIVDRMVRRVVETNHLESKMDRTGEAYFIAIPRLVFSHTTEEDIAELIDDAFEWFDIVDFVGFFFRVIGTAAVALDWNGEPGLPEVETVTGKCDAIAKVVAGHPARRTIMRETISGGALNVLRSFGRLSLAELLEKTRSHYPLESTIIGASPETIFDALSDRLAAARVATGAGLNIEIPVMQFRAGGAFRAVETSTENRRYDGTFTCLERPYQVSVAFLSEGGETPVDIALLPLAANQTELLVSSPALMGHHPWREALTSALHNLADVFDQS